ncbi:MAG TPA: hypothetical protein EYG38_01540, partial [Verrucomicrobia bacterium]|nr:hypothetical protein [Verrucomicrobiota bacterium]
MIKLFSCLFFPLFGIVAFLIANNSVSAQSLSNVSVIDLLVAYSPSAANAGQGERGMRALIEAAVREMNDAHARSLTKVRFNLVGIQQTQEDQFGSVTSSNLRAIR